MPTSFVSGAATPLGMCLVRALLARGGTVLAAVPDPARVPALQDLAAEHPERLVPVPLALRDPASVASLGERVRPRVQRLDLLVSASATEAPDGGLVPPADRLDDLDPERAVAFLRINALAPLLVVRALRPLLRARSGAAAGRVLVVSHFLGAIGERRDGGHYALAMSLAALHMGTRALALELEADGIVVTVGNPGSYKTALHGPAFQLAPEEAAAGLLLAEAATTPETTGRLVDWRGNERGW